MCYIDTYGKIALAGYDSSIHMMTTNGLLLKEKLSYKHHPPTCLEWIGCIEGTVQLWDLDTCSEVYNKKAHDDFITQLLHNPADATMKIWDAQLLECKQVLRGHNRSVTSITHSKEYNCLISAGLDQDAMVWSPCNLRKPICYLRGHPYSLCGVIVVPGTPQVVTADVSGTLRLWDLRNFKSFQTFGGRATCYGDLSTLCAMPPYKQIVTGGSTIDAYTCREMPAAEKRRTMQDELTAALHTSQCNSILTVSKNSVISWDAMRGNVTRVFQDINIPEVTSACLDWKKRKLYLGDNNGGISCFNATNGLELSRSQPHLTAVKHVCPWPETKCLVSASSDGLILVQEEVGDPVQKAQVVFQTSVGRDGVTCMTICDHLKVLACASGKIVHCFCLRRLRKESTLESFSSTVQSIDISPSGEFLVVGEECGIVSVWRLRNTEQQRSWQFFYCWENISQLDTLMCEGLTLEELQNKAHESRAVVDDAQIMNFTYKRNIFSPANDAQELIIPASTRAVKLNRFSGVGLQVYTADERGYLRLWDLSKVQERLLVEPPDRESGHREGIRFAAGSPCSNRPRSGPNAAAIQIRRGAMASRQKTFLTQPTADWANEAPELLEDNVGLRKRRDANAEIRLLHESLGHDGAVRAIDLCDDSTEDPDIRSRQESEVSGCGYHQHWLLSLGFDRVVKVWSLDLQQLGQLTSEVPRTWARLGATTTKRQRIVMRAAGLDLQTIRDRLAERSPKVHGALEEGLEAIESGCNLPATGGEGEA
ncbi:hypothetical protein Esti_002340 [Eimeria stiedai]